MESRIPHKELLLKLLDKFVEVCNSCGLNYYLAGGSVLGAVRHHGMIPWDDDIDVYLMRQDYEKIQQLPQSVWGEEMRLASYKTTPNYTYDFLKLELVNTTIIERLHPDYVGGIFLDIFPLDYVPEDEVARREQLKNLSPIVKTYIDSHIRHDSECANVCQYIKLRYCRFANDGEKLFDTWEKLVVSDCCQKTLLANSHDSWIARPLPASVFAEGVELEFEGKLYRCPKEWHTYLSHIYGDYMQLPPEEKRCGHAFDYVNYERRISTMEAKEIFCQLHKKYAYKVSLKREIKALLHFLKIL